jgi:hypothetical protein
MTAGTFLAAALLVALAFGFAWVTMRLLMPGTVAQIAANHELVQQVNEAFQARAKAEETWKAELDKWKAGVEAKLEVLGKR